MASSHDEIRNYYKVSPERTDRFVDRGKEGGICYSTTYVTVMMPI
jgi:galactokinase